MSHNRKNPIYLDHNATTPVAPEVIEAMLPYLREHFGNPSSGHVYGRRAHAAIERAREQAASLIGAQPDEIFFTSGGTEANNLAIRGLAELSDRRRHIVTSTVEHPATARPCSYLARHGFEITWLPVDGDGRVIPDEARAFVRGDTLLLTVMLAQNEIGTLMPARKLADLAHDKGALVHNDAAQAVGKIPVRVDDLGADLLSIAGHKLYAPKGVGLLYIRRGVKLAPLVLGAGHERGLRPGTENTPNIVGLGLACELAGHGMEAEAARQRVLRDHLWARLHATIPGLRLNGHPTERLPNTLNVSFSGVSGNAVLTHAPEIAASTGSACHEGGESPSGVLLAMGRKPEEALGSVRLSLGRHTTAKDIEEAEKALTRAYRKLRTPYSVR